ncbi:MAG TPA: hypothetical protein VMH05_07530 [Bryobacteraceae bacterium]|nr:hypothetical protein [Bryobacteraceae bacterium]
MVPGRKHVVKAEALASGNPIELPSLWKRLTARVKPADMMNHLN